jgi:ubiquinol-cytochrome c reductase cytochrome c subunit
MLHRDTDPGRGPALRPPAGGRVNPRHERPSDGAQRDQRTDDDGDLEPPLADADDRGPPDRHAHDGDEAVDEVERVRRTARGHGDEQARTGRRDRDGRRREDEPVEPAKARQVAVKCKRGDRDRDDDDRAGRCEEEVSVGHQGQRSDSSGASDRVAARAAPSGRDKSAVAVGRPVAGLVAVIAVAVGLLAVGLVRAPASAATPADAAGLYEATCASCHGPTGEGTDAGPTLVGVGAASADFYLRTGRMPLGAPGQQPIAQKPAFSEDQIQALVAYVASFGVGPPIPQVAAGGDIRDGRRLYTANCAACHAATGSGNAVGGGFAAVGLQNADPTVVAEAMTIGPGAMPRFEFDDAERDAIAAYVQYLRQAPAPGGLPIGGFGPVAEGFVAVAVGVVLLVLVAVFVGRQVVPLDRPAGPGPDTDHPG